MIAGARSSRSSAPGCGSPSGRPAGRSPSAIASFAPESRDAVVDVVGARPPRERHEDGAEPLAAPEELGGLVPVLRGSRRPGRPGRRRSARDRRRCGTRARGAARSRRVSSRRRAPRPRDRARRRRAARARGSRLRLRHARDRVDDRRVAGAAAEVAGEHRLDLVARRPAGPLEQIGRGDQDPRRAEAALQGVLPRGTPAAAARGRRCSRALRPSASVAAVDLDGEQAGRSGLRRRRGEPCRRRRRRARSRRACRSARACGGGSRRAGDAARPPRGSAAR